MADRLCGLNAQTARGPYLTLWARIRNFKKRDMEDQLYQKRNLIKTWLMRGTVHMVPTADFMVYQRAVRRNLCQNWERRKFLSGRELLNLKKKILKILSQGSFTKNELRLRLKGKIPGPEHQEKLILSRTLRGLAYQGLICHDRPTGSWYHFRENRFTTVSSWSSRMRKISEEKARMELLIKYLHGYGPVRKKDFAYWQVFQLVKQERSLIN